MENHVYLLIILSQWLLKCLIFSLFFFWSQPVGCDQELGSKAVSDACGVCKGDNSTCKFYKGLYLNQHKANGKKCYRFGAMSGGTRPFLLNEFET